MCRLTLMEAKALKEKLERLEERSAYIRENFKNGDERTCFCSGSGFDDLPDYGLNMENVSVYAEIKRLRNVLETAIIVEETSTEFIDLGSKFVATTTDSEGNTMTNRYLLLGEGLLDVHFLDGEYMPVSIHSPFGKSVVNKKANEEFNFVSPMGATKGIINEIILEKEKEETSEKGKVKVKKN